MVKTGGRFGHGILSFYGQGLFRLGGGLRNLLGSGLTTLSLLVPGKTFGLRLASYLRRAGSSLTPNIARQIVRKSFRRSFAVVEFLLRRDIFHYFVYRAARVAIIRVLLTFLATPFLALYIGLTGFLVQAVITNRFR